MNKTMARGTPKTQTALTLQSEPACEQHTRGSDSSPIQPAPASSAAPSDAAPAAATTSDSMPAAHPLLSDAQILQVVHTANHGEIAQAKLGEAKAKDARVKKPAAMMIKDHPAADHKAMALAKKLNGPTPSATSTSLESDAQNNTTTLESGERRRLRQGVRRYSGERAPSGARPHRSAAASQRERREREDICAGRAGLYRIGIPKDSILKYETALTADQFVVAAHGSLDDVGAAKRLLESGNELPKGRRFELACVA